MRNDLAKTSFYINGRPWSLDLNCYVGPGKNELTMSASYPGGCGQCYDTLRDDIADIEAPELDELLKIWTTYHFKHAPSETFLRAQDLMRAIDGKRFGSALDGTGDKPDAEFYGDERVSAEDVIKHMEALREYIAETDFDMDDGDTLISQDLWDAKEELEKLEAEESTLESAASEGETLILDSDFEDYARELAEDVEGKAIRDAHWPFNCIDWERAASELQQDYTSVTLDGKDYWVRS